jgi:DNA invertase Pin-like site-specific DNA recombinase
MACVLEAQMSTVYGYYVLVPGPDQRGIIEAFCAERGCVLSRLFEDCAEHRDSAWLARPAVRELMSLLEPGDELVIAGLRSIYANRPDVLTVLRELQTRGIVLHIAPCSAKTPSLTISGALWNAFLQTSDVLFGFNARVRGEAIKEALYLKRLKGERYTCYLPYGWRWETRRGQQRPVPDENERAAIRQIVELRDGGMSWYRIAVNLMRSGVRTARGREWSPSRVRRAYLAATRGRSRPAT